MGGHFSDEQIAEWIAGERVPGREAHLQGCPVCRSRVDEFQRALNGFRASMRAWSGTEYLASAEEGMKTRASSRPMMRSSLYGAAIAAMLCVLMAVVVFHGSQSRRVAPGGTHTSITDAVLLGQIDTEVSQTVPQAMEPLTELVSWDSLADGSSRGKQSEKKAE
jgi:predicted anti-sigma-YlaC factor YlaD